MQPNATRPRRRTTLITATLVTALVAGSMLVQAQGDAAAGTETADATVERSLPAHRAARAQMMMPRAYARSGAAGRPAMMLRNNAAPFGADHSMRGGSRDHGALFARWLAYAPDAAPVAPGLVGRVPDGTEVRLHLYDGDPADGGGLIVTLTYLAGSDDLSAFHADLRDVAGGATHVVIDVLGRTVELTSAEAEAEAESAD